MYWPYLVCQKFTLSTQLQGTRGPAGPLAGATPRPGVRHSPQTRDSPLECRRPLPPTLSSVWPTRPWDPPLAEIAVTAMQLPESHPHGTLREVQLADPLLGPLLLGKEEGKKPPLPGHPIGCYRSGTSCWSRMVFFSGTFNQWMVPWEYSRQLFRWL